MKLLKNAGTLLVALVLLALPLIVWWQAQAIQDWWKLRGYTPPAAIAQLASQDTMKPYTQHMFYVNHPQLISGVANFRQNYCPENQNTIVLGCYHVGQNGIFIYKITDPSLYGVEQVTAAHEVLHAVYARLSSADRTQLNKELESYYKNGLTDQRVQAEVKLYQQTEPDSVYDEMSCTFGTELADLPPNLEAYYDRYFSNRAAIVEFEQKYQGALTSRQSQISVYDTELAGMKNQIDSEEQSLSNQLNQIDADRNRLNSQKASNNYAAYNAGVSGFNAEVDAYNRGVAQLQNDIANYNSLVTTRNAIAQELRSLDSAIDTRLTTQTSQ